MQTQAPEDSPSFPIPEVDDEEGGYRSFRVDNLHPTKRVNRRNLQSAALAALKHEGFRYSQVNLILLDAEDMRQYNRDFHDDDQSTDHLGFQYEAADGFVSGDVLVCLDVCAEQAVEYAQSFHCELSRVAIHGILHLCGWQDHTPAKRKKMHERENLILAELEKRPAMAAWLKGGTC